MKRKKKQYFGILLRYLIQYAYGIILALNYYTYAIFPMIFHQLRDQLLCEALNLCKFSPKWWYDNDIIYH